MLKRLLALCLTLMLLAGFASGEGAQAVITIDGVRAAFFSSDNAYLPPAEVDGILYVPVLSLAESLGLDVQADPETLAVTVDGVRTAFFGEDNAYLPPALVNGEVYVPLAAFCRAAGVALSVEDGTYRLTRPGRETPAPVVITAAPVATAAPQYGYVLLTESNFYQYFDIDCNITYPQNFPSTMTITYTLTCRPISTCEIISASFRATCGEASFWVTLSSNGTATDSVRKTYYQGATDDISWILQAGSIKSSAILSVLKLESAYGRLRLPYSEAARIHDPVYDQAVGLMDSDPSRAAELFAELAKVDWRDSADKAEEARGQVDAVSYRDAQADIRAGRWDAAIKRLEPLAKKGFEDSKALLIQAKDGQSAARYEAAEALLAEGRYTEAQTAFEALAAEGYRDSADRAKEAQNAVYAYRYAAAEALLGEGRWDEAEAAFGILADVGYSDSADRAKEAVEGRLAERYAAALADMEAGNHEKAALAFDALAEEGYSDSADQAAEARRRRHAIEYRAAEIALEAERYDDAIAGFDALAKLGYEDSADRAAEVRETKNSLSYAAAEAALSEERFDEAIAGFDALAAIGYADSKTRAAGARMAKSDWEDNTYGEAYAAGLSLLAENSFAKAVEILTPLAEASYKDSAGRLAEAQACAAALSAWEKAYAKGLELEGDKKYGKALDQYEKCLGFRNAEAHAAWCLLQAGADWMTPPYKNKVCFQRGDKYGVADWEDGTYSILDIRYFRAADLWSQGVIIAQAGQKVGMLNASGRWIVKAEYTDYRLLGTEAVAFRDSSGWFIFNLKGKKLNSKALAAEPSLLTAGWYQSWNNGVVSLIKSTGKSYTLKRNPNYIMVDTDGTIWYTIREGSSDTIYNLSNERQWSARRIGSDKSLWGDERYKVCEGRVAFSYDDRTWGIYDLRKAKVILNPTWRYITPFTKNGVARVWQIVNHKDRYGLISASGQTISGANFTLLNEIYNGAAVCSTDSEKRQKGLVSEQGRMLAQGKYYTCGKESVSGNIIVTIALGKSNYPSSFTLQILNSKGSLLHDFGTIGSSTRKELLAGGRFLRLDDILYDVSGKKIGVITGDILHVSSDTKIVLLKTTGGSYNLMAISADGSRRKLYSKAVSGWGDLSPSALTVNKETGAFALKLKGSTKVYTAEGTAPSAKAPRKVSRNTADDLQKAREAAGQ